MNIRELIAAYSDMKSALAAPELRRYMTEELPRRLPVPEKAYKRMIDDAKYSRDITDLIGEYTGVHPKDIGSMTSSEDIPEISIDDFRPGLHSAMQEYADVGYRPINKVFRDAFGPSMSTAATEQANVMLDAFKPTKNDMVVYRGLRGEGPTADKIRSMKLRDELKQYGNKSFMSTTFDPAVSRGFADSPNPANNFRIVVPSGTPVLPVHSYTSNKILTPELEYLLPPDSRFDILPPGSDRYQLASNMSKINDLPADIQKHADKIFDTGDELQKYLKDYVPEEYHDYFRTRVLGGNDYTDLILSHPGKLPEARYVPDAPGVGWLAGLAPVGAVTPSMLDKYVGSQDQ